MSRLFALFPLCVSFAAAPDWPRYRGPNGSGVAMEGKAPSEIGKDRNVVWKAAALKGNSSPIIVKDRLFFTGHEGDERFLLCYDAEKGALLWRKGITKARTETANPLNGPTTPTPATDGRSIFAFFPEFGLLAYDFDGKERWRVPLGPFAAIQGIASSPVYAEGVVALLIDTPDEAYLAAFEARTGNQAWKVERPVGFLGSYATPSVYKPAQGPTQLVVAGAMELTGYEAKTGERLWWARSVAKGPAALPLIAGDSVYTIEPAGEGSPPFSQMIKGFDKNQDGKVALAEVSGDSLNDKIMYRVFRAIDRHVGNRDGEVTEEEFNKSFDPNDPAGGLVRTRLGGSGDVTQTHVGWRFRKGMPYVTAPLLYEGVLYVVKDGGILSTFDPDSGKLLRQDRLKPALGQYYASPVASGRRIYFVDKDGKATVIQAGKDWQIVSTADLEEQVIATPAISGSRLFVRTENTVYCFRSN
jgi:outer membrane protein assembly factor BamB